MLSPKVIGAIFLLIVLTASHFGAWYMGRQSCQVKEQKAVIAEQVRQDVVAQKLQVQQAKRQIVYIDRLKVIHDAKDSCLDSPVPDSVLRTLRPDAK